MYARPAARSPATCCPGPSAAAGGHGCRDPDGRLGFANRLSRLVVDPERFLDPAAEEMEAVGMGAVYLATSDRRALRHPDAEHRRSLLQAFFQPYADALADLVDARLAAVGRAVLLDVHSYPATPLPYELHAGQSRPQVCLGTDRVHTPSWLLAAATAAFADWQVAQNEPFAGTYVPLRHLGRELRVASLMVEVRRDGYVDDEGQVDLARLEALTAALARLAVAASDG